jgi:hypothetical protein
MGDPLRIREDEYRLLLPAHQSEMSLHRQPKTLTLNPPFMRYAWPYLPIQPRQPALDETHYLIDDLRLFPVVPYGIAFT